MDLPDRDPSGIDLPDAAIIPVDMTIADDPSANPFSIQNQPRSVAFARAPSLAESLLRYNINDPLLHARLREVRITPELQLRCSEFHDPLLLLAVVDFELPDVVGVLPIWQQMAHSSPRAELRVICYNELPLLERMLDGDASLDLETLEAPMLLFFDEEFHLLAHWGPRPRAAEHYIEEWLAQHPDFDQLIEDESPEGAAAFGALHDDLVRYMRVWYNSELDKESSMELERLLAALQGEGGENGASHSDESDNDSDDMDSEN